MKQNVGFRICELECSAKGCHTPFLRSLSTLTLGLKVYGLCKPCISVVSHNTIAFKAEGTPGPATFFVST